MNGLRVDADGRGLEESRAAYRRLCELEDSIPLFSNAWLLDALVPGEWGAVLDTDNGGTAVGAMPFLWRRRAGLRISTMPTLVPRLGPWLSGGIPATPKETSRQYRVLGNLAAGTPDVHYFAQNWNPEVSTWLPFHWAGFRQTTYYTYRLDPRDLDQVWYGMVGTARTEVRKARDRYGLRATTEAGLEEFLRLNALVFARQGIAQPYSAADLKTLDTAVRANAERLILVVRDTDGRAHAACYVLWDANCAYYLLGGSDPALRSNGSMYLAVWEAIQYISGKTAVFDFEGSMIQSIASMFHRFGGVAVPYHSVTRVRGRLARAAVALLGR